MPMRAAGSSRWAVPSYCALHESVVGQQRPSGSVILTTASPATTDITPPIPGRQFCANNCLKTSLMPVDETVYSEAVWRYVIIFARSAGSATPQNSILAPGA
jgi:hypothetical protein